jgi:hypothetical protein
VFDPERARTLAAVAIRAAAEVKNHPPDLINVALELLVKESHVTPTGASWLNMVEIWFSILTKQQVRRGVYHDVPELIAAIGHFVDGYNERAYPIRLDHVLAKAIKDQLTFRPAG